MSAAREAVRRAEDDRARGAQPTPAGPVRARGRSPTRRCSFPDGGAMRASRRARRCASSARATRGGGGSRRRCI